MSCRRQRPTRPPPALMRKLEMLGLWLLEASRSGPQAPENLDILRLMLRCVVQSSHTGERLAGHRSEQTLRNHHRLDALLRVILRGGAFELGFSQETPARSVISEYVGLAHDFFGGKEPAMANGILDAMARVLRSDEF